jgi:thymidylate synthase ThyX
MIKAEIIADSINPKNCRITSWILEFPRMVHAELMTHRVFSKNAASSRAIPIEKMIQQVIDNPAMPVWWGKNQPGMQAKEELGDKIVNVGGIGKCYIENAKYIGLASGIGKLRVYEMSEKDVAKQRWLDARDSAIEQVKELSKLGLHKQIANRILEPWFNIRVILTGTDFENWFALRAHPDAQPEIRVLAEQMLELYNASEPNSLNVGEWHIPFGDKIDNDRVFKLINFENIGSEDVIPNLIEKYKLKIVTARCARISYFNFEGKDDYSKDVETCDKLFGNIPRHLSPAEHPAQCMDDESYYGNFRGFKQYRKFFSEENLTDSRVIKKYWKKIAL